MEILIELIDKIPLPFVWHDNSQIIHTNTAFKNFLSDQQNITDLDFVQWLMQIIRTEEDRNLISDAIKTHKEITLNTQGDVKGVLRHWIISSFPVALNTTNEKNQFTYLQDASIAYVSKSYWDLHLRVSKATMELMKEIAERKKAEETVTALSGQLVTAARRAGMADVATSVLHNIGNVLNSVNISVEIIGEKAKLSKIAGLTKLADLIRQHQEEISTFIAHDQRGQQIPAYIIMLSEAWHEENAYLLEEIEALKKNILHIKNIVAAQQSLSVVVDVTEKVVLTEVLEDALALNKNVCERTSIEIVRDYMPLKKIIIDKVKLLQIIVNLVKNSVDSLVASKAENKQLIVRVREGDEEHFIIEVSDNGVGISPENTTKIFSFGFTTKETGHGFGLHSSALSAREMGGDLSVQSEGIGKGATFTLTLPYFFKCKTVATK